MTHQYTSEQLNEAETLEARFRMLDMGRTELLEQGREYSKYTLPRLFPEENQYPHARLPELYSSHAGRLVSQLAAKLMAAVFPLNDVPFFTFSLPQEIIGENGEVVEIEAANYQDLQADALSLEKDIMDRLRSSNLREALQAVFEHLIVIGDVVIYQDDEYNFRVYRVDQFVLRRDAAGNVAEIMVRDWLEPDLLEDELKNLNGGKPATEVTQQHGRLEPHYTRLLKNGDKWDVVREFRKVSYEKDVSYKVSPYYHIGWARVFPGDYSRSLVEENFGTIRSLEQLEEAIVKAIAVSSKGIVGVDPTGLTKIEDLETERDWEFAYAREQDVWSLQIDTRFQAAAADAAADKMKRELDEAFLSNQATSLRGERVTAYQVQESVAEMQQALGGVLGQAASRVQRPIVERSLEIERKQGRLSEADKAFLDNYAVLQVKTGLDALGRQMEGARIQSVVQVGQAIPEIAAEFDMAAVTRGLVNSAGLDVSLYLKTDEVKQQEQQALLAQQATQQGIQQAVQSTGRIAEQQAAAEQV